VANRLTTSSWAWGLIPLECIRNPKRKAGVPDALDSIQVKHVSGGFSKVSFRAYEQGAKKHMGSRIDLGWLDEEPPEDIWAQYIRGTLATKGILFITFTPEEGVTKVVHGFLNDLKPGQYLMGATWDDAPHMNHDRREQVLMAIPAHQREMRSKGVPLMGSGLVYQVAEDRDCLRSDRDSSLLAAYLRSGLRYRSRLRGCLVGDWIETGMLCTSLTCMQSPDEKISLSMFPS
jgi:phage terminase large subunit-like protein